MNDDAIFLTYRVDCIAGKPPPNGPVLLQDSAESETQAASPTVRRLLRESARPAAKKRVSSRSGVLARTKKTRSDHAARSPITTTAQRLWMVGMVVATGMHHQRMAFDFGNFLQARREDRIVGGAISIDV